MNTNPPLPQDQPDWRDDLSSLFAQPVEVEEGIYREGEFIGVRITPSRSQGQTTVDLLVSLFFLALPPLQSQETEAHNIVLQDCLADVRNADYHIRVAACRALGQLGDITASDALRHALQDKNRYVRAAAAQALTVLEKPRYQKEELAGVRLLLWQQVRHLWRPLTVVQTNHRGQARLLNTRVGAHYRLQLLAHTRQGRNTLTAQAAPMYDEEALAAEEAGIQPSLLPPPQQLALEDGILHCSFFRDDQEQLVLEFRSDAPQLRESWVHLRIVRQDTHEEVVNDFVQLEATPRGVVVGRFVFTEVFDLTQAHELFFEPLPLTDKEG